MPRLQYFLVAEGVSVDEATKKVSAFHILEQLLVPEVPTVIPFVVALTCWESRADEMGRPHAYLLRQTLPNGKVNEVRSRFQVEQRWHRLRQQFLKVPILQPGELVFELLLEDGRELARYAVEVKLQVRGTAPPVSQRN